LKETARMAVPIFVFNTMNCSAASNEMVTAKTTMSLLETTIWPKTNSRDGKISGNGCGFAPKTILPSVFEQQ
jgi:hypothetical protein